MLIYSALCTENRKLRLCPYGDMDPQTAIASGYGYVCTAYLLIEQCFKELIRLHEAKPKKTHELMHLFDQLPDGVKAHIGEYYDDLINTCGRFNSPDLSLIHI